MNGTPQPRREERQMIHWSELPEDTTGNAHARNWNFYRREVGRLLAEGHEGRWVVVKGEQIIGIWDTQEEAFADLYRRYQNVQALVHQVLEREPLLRTPTFLWRPRWRS
jgi:hypothetical protein